MINNTKTNLIFAMLLIIATIFATIMLPSNIKSFTPTANAQAKQDVKNTPKKENTKPHCDVNCKIKVLEDMKFNPDLAYHIVWSCKNNAKDPVHCIKWLSAVSMSESSGGWHCNHKYNCFGIGRGNMKFNSFEEGTNDWVTRYNKYWYTANTSAFFYGYSADKPANSRYCMDEVQTNGKIVYGWCPMGKATAQSIVDKLNSKF